MNDHILTFYRYIITYYLLILLRKKTHKCTHKIIDSRNIVVLNYIELWQQVMDDFTQNVPSHISWQLQLFYRIIIVIVSQLDLRKIKWLDQLHLFLPPQIAQMRYIYCTYLIKKSSCLSKLLRNNSFSKEIIYKTRLVGNLF